MIVRGYVHLSYEDYLNLGYFETRVFNMIEDEVEEYSKQMSKMKRL
jgi:hypothetical protein